VITNKDKLKMSGFTGVQEVGENLDDRIDEIHGMFDKHVGSLERLRGKLSSITSNTSSVWNINHLKFGHGSAIVHRDNTTITAETLQPDWGDLDFDFEWPDIPRVQEENYERDIHKTVAEKKEKRDAWISYYNEPAPPTRAPNDPLIGLGGKSGTLTLKANPDVFVIDNWNHTDDHVSIIELLREGVHEDCFLMPVLVRSTPSPNWFYVNEDYRHIDHRSEFIWLMISKTGIDIASLAFTIGPPLFFPDWWDDVPIGTTIITVKLSRLNGWFFDSSDSDRYISTNDEGNKIEDEVVITINKCAFTVTAPATVQRGVAFSLDVECTDPTYSPVGASPNILVEATDAGDALTPVSVTGVGWVGGQITVNDRVIAGGHGYGDTAKIKVTSPDGVLVGISDEITITPVSGEFWSHYDVVPPGFEGRVCSPVIGLVLSNNNWTGRGPDGYYYTITWGSGDNKWRLRRGRPIGWYRSSYKAGVWAATPVGIYSGTHTVTANEVDGHIIT